MPMIWEGWDADPGNNGKPPPDGAPEGRTSHGALSDICRRIMAAVYEIGSQLQTLTEDTLGTMAEQDADDVEITGGTIASGASIDAAALKSGTIPIGRLTDVQDEIVAGDADKVFGLTKQQLYDMIWPVGSERGWDKADFSGLVPAGVTATWSQRAIDCIIVGEGNVYSYGVIEGSGTAATAAAAGGHTHTAAGTTLNATQVPAALVTDVAYATGAAPGVNEAEAGDDYSLAVTKNTGGGQSHTHTIASVADHTHTLSLPQRYPTYWLKRTA